MTRRAKISILFLVAFAAIRADTVELKTGEKVEGVFRQAGKTGAVIEVGGQPLTFPLEKIRAIYFGPMVAEVAQPANEQLRAIEAIKGIQSIARAGVSYRDYAPRVLDAKVQVDRFVNSTQGTAKLRYAIKSAMAFYNLASRAWNARLFGETLNSNEQIAIGRTAKDDLLFNACPELHERIKILKAGSNYPADHVNTLRDIGKDLGDRIDMLWSCASSKVAEAGSL